MVTESPVKMFPGLGMRASLSESLRGSNSSRMQDSSPYNEELGKELGMMLREQRRYEISERERELSLYRSGSAPPTVDGSLAAVGCFFGHNGGVSGSATPENGRANSNSNNSHGFASEEELRSDPAYLSYYYSHVNLNPRLPPPILSKEDWRFAQRLQAGTSPHGGIGDRRKLTSFDDGNNKSLFSLQPVLPSHNEENEGVEKLQQGNLARQSSSSTEWFERGTDGLIGLSSGGGLGARRKSLADILQEDLGRSSPAPRHPSRPASRNAFDDGVDTVSAEAHVAQMRHDITGLEGLRSGSAIPGLARVQSLGAQSSHAYASALGVSRSQTPDPQHVVTRSPSPCLTTMGGRFGIANKQNVGCSSSFNGVSSSATESEEIAAALAGISLSSNGVVEEERHAQSHLQQDITEHQSYLFHLQSGQKQYQQHSHAGQSQIESVKAPVLTQAVQQSLAGLSQSNRGLKDSNMSSATSQLAGDSLHIQKQPMSRTPNLSSAAAEASSTMGISNVDMATGTYQNANIPNAGIPNYGMSGYPINSMLPSMMGGYLGPGSLPPTFENALSGMDLRSASGGLSGGGTSRVTGDLQNLYRLGGQPATGLQMPVDPYLQYFQRSAAEYAAQMAQGLGDPSLTRNYMGGSYVDLLEFQKACLGAYFVQQKSQYGMPFLGKGGTLNPGYYANPSFGLAMPYPGSPITSPVLPSSPVAPASPPVRHGDRSHRFPPPRGSTGGIVGPWHSENGGNMEDTYGSSLLEEFKNSKTRCLELSEIIGHVVEFSSDQYGSRFIQQKLETASVEEKNMVFKEIFPQALTLMTDVFGNYVIQKFFEHGTENQRKDLANELSGHILTLSLQMYGCRVIQKAIEVLDEDQQGKMVLELDGHIMRCVRDQNGNHVIQKCIECIPQDKIQFIISSFFGQVVALSTHPYGCRVIQRVLEHCTDAKTQSLMMDEILQAVCTLAQDQYGNYVVQHVLEHGKPNERAAVIKKLAGQIVQMSQQKFASNVVEKCLVFGGPAERQILISEMLGSTDENEPLQAMMKDQFANYVVQKVLETCDDQQRELILSRIKVHLNALKKYTYGKHIVVRVEKLVAAGERRIGTQSTYLS
uniref:TSA: Wollemia nobilis Ref_Wollemi_Transcript_3604_4174 transcribed RNA sequence n=1 Tax=Wollemia nobilis TaxID=56998 RepID=A0A0C9SAH0_9CONI